MASINVDELRDMLKQRGQVDADDFLEITFLREAALSPTVDSEYRDKVLTVECPYGTVTITFDNRGQLRSLDIS